MKSVMKNILPLIIKSIAAVLIGLLSIQSYADGDKVQSVLMAIAALLLIVDLITALDRQKKTTT